MIAHKPKASTGLGEWVADDLVFFDVSELLEVFFESLISEVVV